jgi:peptidoglycan/LPS O-acetylase OafA/YrhL
MNPKTTYYPYFDYLRIALAAIVMLGHDGLIHWSQSGNLAVQVFFALSGWLIGGILLKLSKDDLPRFYFNRALRIWIPYYIACIFLIIASLLRDPINLKWTEFIFYKLSFVYNIFGTPQLDQYAQNMPLQGTGNHFWSVNAEEQFYLIAPLLLVLTTPKLSRSVLFWSAITLIACLSNIYGSIVFGVLASVVVNRYGPIHLNNRVRSALLSTTLASIVGIVGGFNYAILSPIFSVGVVLLLAVKGTQSRIGTFLGGISYPLYLNHWIGVFMGNLLLSPINLRDSPLRHILSIILNLGIAAGLYWWVDRRIVEIRGSLFSKKRGIMAIAIAYSLAVIGVGVGIGFTLFSPALVK